MAVSGTDFEYCMDFLRESDRDRYLASLLVPDDKRPAVAALYAFNAEIARIRDLIREPMPGEIRIQWWRELIANAETAEGAGHPVASALLAAIEQYNLPRATFDAYLDARIFDLYDDPMPDRATFEGYAGETASALVQLAALVLSPEAARQASEAAGHAGVALAIAGSILLLPIHRVRGQIYVPGDILSATGLSREAFLAGKPPEACISAVSAFIALGREHLGKARSAAAGLPFDVSPAFVPAALADPVFDRAEKAGVELFDHGIAIPQWRRQWRFWRAARTGSF